MAHACDLSNLTKNPNPTCQPNQPNLIVENHPYYKQIAYPKNKTRPRLACTMQAHKHTNLNYIWTEKCVYGNICVDTRINFDSIRG